MAIYHMTTKAVQRSKGRSAVAAAAYRSAEKLEDERLSETYDYTRKQRVAYSEILTPDNSTITRSELWNLAEQSEKRKDSTTAKEIEIALPHELSFEQQRELALDFARHIMRERKCAIDVCIHAPGRETDDRNFHAHLLLTTREYSASQLHAKCASEISDADRKKRGLCPRRAEYTALREQWATMCNHALEKNGHEARVSHLSNAERGIEEEPTKHLGPHATALERRGILTRRGDLNRSVHDSAEARELRDEIEMLKTIDTGVDNAKREASAYAPQSTLSSNDIHTAAHSAYAEAKKMLEAQRAAERDAELAAIAERERQNALEIAAAVALEKAEREAAKRASKKQRRSHDHDHDHDRSHGMSR